MKSRTILVTGGTGTLGRPTVRLLQEAGHDIRVLSRKPGEGRVIGDLATGDGLTTATAGAHTVLHLAMGLSHEAEQTERVLAAARVADVQHLIYISIVGIDDNPYSYYRQKLAAERAVESGGVPWTILRATQFHDFLAGFIRPQSRFPLVLLPDMRLQPIAVNEVAVRLVELATGPVAGHVDDIAGPEQGDFAEFGRQWFAAHGRNKRVASFRFPGAAGRAFRTGANLGTLPGYGRQTFAEWATAAAAEATA